MKSHPVASGFSTIAIDNFTVEPKHFLVETFPRILVEIFTGCGSCCHPATDSGSGQSGWVTACATTMSLF